MPFSQQEDLHTVSQLAHKEETPWSSSTWKQQDGFDKEQSRDEGRGGVPPADICQSSRADSPHSLLTMSDQKLWKSCLC